MTSTLLTILFPICGVIAVGWLGRKTGVQEKGAVIGLSNYVYYIALPAFIFQSLISSDLGEHFTLQDLQFLAGTLLAHLLIFFVALFVLSLAKIKKDVVKVFPMLITFGSTAYFGIPYVSFAFGKEGTAYASLISVVLVIALLLASILFLRKDSPLKLQRRTLKTLFELPLLWAVVAGLLWPVLHLPPLPNFISALLDTIAAGASPVALLALGSYIYDFSFRDIPWAQAITASFIKVVFPAFLTFFILRWLGVDGIRLAIATSMAATPTAITCFVLSKEYKVGERLTAGTILFSIFFSFAAVSVISYLWLNTSVFL